MKRISPIGFILTITGFSFFLSCNKSDSSSENPPAADTVIKSSDIYYTEGDTMHRHTLDVYYRQYSGNYPVILFVPGGAWRQGDKDQYETMAYTLSRLYHYVIVAANYRLSNPDDGSAVHPDHIQDVALAFKWVMDNIAGYGGDTENVFLFGQSAGAHLVSLLTTDVQYLEDAGYSTNTIRGVISMSGAYSLDDLVAYPLNPLGLNAEEVLMYKTIIASAFGSWDTTVINPASPSHHIHDSIPPLLLIYTEMDLPGFAPDAMNFSSQLTDAGATQVNIFKLFEEDYSEETWQTAIDLAASEPAFAEYVGHYAEVVAINENDHLKVPTVWIVDFIEDNRIK